jgi:alkanesulfonate monooxygenase SsuD/methylene tetrahydromethanopterin reductase-like flavin-dependent oxidoreductase (luciferase family)
VVASTPADLERRCAAAGLDPARAGGAPEEGVLVGTPEQVVEKLQRVADLGARRIYLQCMDMTDLDHLDLIAAEVLPHVTDTIA